MNQLDQFAVDYMDCHPDGVEWSNMPEKNRTRVLALAAADIAAYLNLPKIDMENNDQLAACCEQALWLLRRKTKQIVSEKIDGVGQCTYADSSIAFNHGRFIAERAELLVADMRPSFSVRIGRG